MSIGIRIFESSQDAVSYYSEIVEERERQAKEFGIDSQMIDLSAVNSKVDQELGAVQTTDRQDKELGIGIECQMIDLSAVNSNEDQELEDKELGIGIESQMIDISAISSNTDHELEDKELGIGIESQMIDISAVSSNTDCAALESVVSNTKQLRVTWQRFKVFKFKNCVSYIVQVSSAPLLVIINILLILIYINVVPLDLSRNLQNVSSNNQDISNDFMNLLYETLSRTEESLKEIILLNDIQSPTSCADILYRNSSSSSGYYLVRSSTCQLTSVYCDMTRTCGNITGGWMRVAELDLDHCFTGLRSQSFDGIRTCVVSEDGAGCTSVLFSSFNIQYTSICGTIRGYGVGTVDGLYYRRTLRGSLTDNYLDGISVSSDGNHIWSFVAGNCACNYKPSFIGNDWTCDGTGCREGYFCNKLLWNTSTCGVGGLFLKQVSSSTTADINVTVCRDEPRDNEDIAITVVELFVN